MHNLMYYLLDQQENWDIHELHFSCDFAQNNLKPNILFGYHGYTQRKYLLFHMEGG